MTAKQREDMSREELLAELKRLELAVEQSQRGAASPDRERLLDELQVHEVELEAQNHALRTAQRQLEEAATRYADLYDFAPVGYCTLAADGRVEEINLTGARLLGLPREGALGRLFTEVAPLRDRAVFLSHLARCVKEGRRVVSEVVLARGPGPCTLQLISEPLRTDSGPVTTWRTVMIDVSAQKKLEEKLRLLSEAAEVLSSSLDYAARVEAAVRLAVPTLADFCLVDVARETGKGERLVVAFPQTGRYRALADCLKRLSGRRDLESPQDRVMTSGEPLLLEEVSDQARGQLSYDHGQADLAGLTEVRSMMIVPLAARGRVLGSLTLVSAESARRYAPGDLKVAQDLAGRTALALDNARLYAEAQAAIAARDATLAFVSHDLRNPLAVILMKASLMLREPNEERRQASRMAVDAICRSAERMGRLIQDLLEVSSLEAGRFSLERARHPAQALVAEALDAVRPEAARRELELVCELPEGEALEVDCDRDRALQVFANVLGNALKFTGPRGRVVVSARPLSGEVCFEVADTGVGIAPEDLPHVFDRFWQAQKTARMGTGLGLSIARGIVETHGGRIWAESHLGVGSTFRFTLPLARPAAGSLAGALAAAGGPADKLVLLAEDDGDVREVLSETLRESGYQVTAVENGAQALAMLRSGIRPALILLDLLMPVMDGWEFLAARAADPELERIPVVVLSGERDVQERIRAAKATWVPKPVALERLFEVIERQERARVTTNA